MAFKRYIKINGKNYGPYYYKSYRENGKVINKYISKEIEPSGDSDSAYKSQKYGILAFLLLALFCIGLIWVMSNLRAIGHASLNIETEYVPGENLLGNINFNLKQGELIPANSMLILEMGNNSIEVPISDVIDNSKVSGDFFAEGVSLSGNGEGYGIPGSKIIYPKVDFELLVSADSGSVNDGEQPEVPATQPEEVTNNDEAVINDGTALEDTANNEPTTDNAGESPANDNSGEGGINGGGITGGVISENDFIVSGSASKGEDYVHILEDGQSAKVVFGSVKVDRQEIGGGEVDLEVSGNEARVSTEYSTLIEGFGEDYIGEETLSLSADISKFNVRAEQGELKVKLVYDNNVIAEVSEDISVLGKEIPASNLSLVKDVPAIRIQKNSNYSLNLGEYFAGAERYAFEGANISAEFDGENIVLIPDVDFKGSRKGKIIAYAGASSLESNEFNILVSSGAINIDVSRGKIRVGELVRWVQNISLEEAEDIAIELPKEAQDIVVRKIENEITENVDAQLSGITGNVIYSEPVKAEESKGWFSSLFEKKTSGNGRIGMTGLAISEEENNSAGGGIEVLLDKNATEYSIEYYTEAPQAFEEITDFGKKVVISGPDELNYTNILSFTNISEVFGIGEEDEIKIYWVENDSYMPFDAYDVNENGKIDYVEWITPHLSNQTFEIILITGAQHLDENRTFISDIYGEVKELDGNWSEPIYHNQYVRVTFEQNLTNGNIINIYARNIQGLNSSIEIYEKDGLTLLASTPLIIPEQMYNIQLDGMSVSNDVFDIKVVNDENNTGVYLEVDYIKDAASLSSFNGSFFDGFESASLATNNWERSVGDYYWGISTNSPYAGTYDLLVDPRNVAGEIVWVNISTNSYENIKFSFYAKTSGLDSGEYVKADWYNGTGWTELMNAETLDSWTLYNYSLNVAANNNTDFKIRFRCSASNTNEKCFIDNVNVSGSLISSDLIDINETVGNSAGTGLTTNLEIIDSNNVSVYNDTKVSHGKRLAKGLYKIKIMPQNNLIKEISINDFDIKQNINQMIDIENPSDNQGWDELYSVRPDLNLTGTNTTIDITVDSAKGNTLYKCKDWNFTTQTCYGTWQRYYDMIPGQSYTFTILGEDPGFVETNESTNYLFDVADTQFSTYKQMKNVTIGGTRYTSGTIDIGTTGIKCWTNNWTSHNWTMLTSVNGAWNFSVYGYCSSGTPIAYLFATIFKLNATGRYYIANTTQSSNDLCSDTSDPGSINTWNYNLAAGALTNLSLGERVAIQVCANVTQGQSGTRTGRIQWEDAVPSNIMIPFKNWDSVAPQISYGTGTETSGSILTRRNIIVNVTASDDVHLRNVTINLYNSTGLVNSSASTTSPIYLNFTNLIDGIYYFNATAYDYDANINSTSTRNVTIDATPPSINFTSPTETSGTTLTNGNNILINVTAADSVSGLKNITINLYNSTGLVNSTTTLTPPNFVNISNLTNGIYYFNATAYDNAGNYNTTNTRNTTINYDTISPLVSITYPLDITYNVNVSELNYTYFDLNPGKCRYSNNSGVTNSTPAVNAGVNFTNVISIKGSNTWRVYCNDSVGNFNSTNVTFFVVIGAPNITLIAPANNAIDVDGQVGFECSAASTDGLTKIELYINNVLNKTTNVSGNSNQTSFNLNLADGLYTWNCTAYDIYGATNTSSRSLNVSRALTPVYNPAIFAGNTTNWSNVPDITNVCNGTAILDKPALGMIKWNGCVNALGANFDINVIIGDNNVTVLSSGLHSSFNSTAVITIRNLTWDAPPVIYIDGVLCLEPVCTNVSYDEINGIAVFNVTHFTSFVTGSNSRLEIWDETDAGMPFGGQTKYKIENVKFFANYTKKSDGGPITGATCRVNFTDSTNNLMSYNTTLLVYEYSRTFADNGTFPWNVTCSATGRNTLTTNDTVLISADANAPLISIISPQNTTYNNATQLVNISASDSIGISRIWFTNSSGQNETYTTSIYRTFAEGLNTLRAWANDTSGNVNFTSIVFNIDTTYPVVSVYSPLNQSYNNRTIFVNFTADSYQALWFNNGTANISYTNPTPANSNEGSNTFVFYANDSAGNINSTSVVFFVDSINPLISFVSPTPLNNSILSQNNIPVNVSMNETNLDKVVLRLYNSTALINTTISSSSNLFVNFTNLANGIYYINATANDTLGNMNTTSTRKITLDTTKPNVAITYPQNISYGDSVEQLNYSASDVNLQACWYSTNNGAINYSVTCGQNATGLTSSEGSNTWIAWANDSAGNVNYSSVTFIVDLSAPGIYFVTPTENNGNYLNRKNIQVNVTASNLQVTNVTINLYNATGLVNSSMTNESGAQAHLYANFSNLNDGVYYFNATTNDAFSRSNSTDTRSVTIDTIKPLISLVHPTDNSGINVNRNNIVINASAYDINLQSITISIYNSSSGLVNSYSTSSPNSSLFVNQSGLGDGIYYFNATATDLAGNENYSETRNITLETQAPLITINSPQNITYTTQIILFNITLSENGNCLYSLDSSGNKTMSSSNGLDYTAVNSTMSEGSHTAVFSCNDSVGNFNSTFVVFGVDTIAPLISIVSPENTSYNNGTQLVNISTSGASYVWFFNGTENETYTTSVYKTFGEGSNILYAYANDSAGNLNSTTKVFFVDSNIPQVSVVYPQNTTYTVNVSTLNYTYSDTNPGKCWYSINGGVANSTLVNAGVNFTGITSIEGSNRWRVYCNDTLGNLNSSSVVFFKDTVLPVVSVYSPQNTSYNNKTIFVNFTADNYQALWFNNGTANISYTTPTPANSNEGSNTFVFYANDSAGNLNLTSVVFNVDTTYPIISIVSPANTTYNNATLLINISTTGATNVWFYNGTGNSTYNNSTYQTFAEGSNMIYAYANDSVGNLNSTSVVFFVDSIKPLISFGTGTETSGTIMIRTNIVVNASASDSNFANLTINLYNSTGIVNTTTTLTISLFLNFTNLADEIYYFNATALDLAGNSNSTETRNVTIDTRAPVVVDLIPVANTTFNPLETIEIGANVSNANNIDKVFANLTLANGTARLITLSNASGAKYNNSFAIPGLEGRYNATIIANDSIGNVNNSETTYFVVRDSIVPSIYLFNPGNGVNYITTSQNVVFQYNVSDFNIANCSLIVNNAVVNLSLSVNTSEGAINQFTNVFGVGSYSWNINCSDNNNNNNASTARSFSVTAPVVTPPSEGGGGGGGAGVYLAPPAEVAEKPAPISVNPEELSIMLVAGTGGEREITIRNLRNATTELTIAVEGEVAKILRVQGALVLEPNEEKVVKLTINEAEKGLLTGKLVVRTIGYSKDVPVVINLKSENFLFDSALTIPGEYRAINPGEDLVAQVNLLQVGPKEKVDVVATYVIKDLTGKKYLEETETFFVLEAKDYVKTFHTDSFPAGKYVLGLDIVYPGAFATSSAQFEILATGVNKFSNQTIILIIALGAIGIGFLVWVLRARSLLYKGLVKRGINRKV